MKKFILKSLLVSAALGTAGQGCDDTNARITCIEERACCGWILPLDYVLNPEVNIMYEDLKRVCSGEQDDENMDVLPPQFLPEDANFTCTDPKLVEFLDGAEQLHVTTVIGAIFSSIFLF